jgi:hypothetical protein
MGDYDVSPSTHATSSGRFRASVTVQHAHGLDRSTRRFEYDTTFASRDAARIFAVTQGWLHTCLP